MTTPLTKPLLPVGTEVPGFPSVRRVLHVDAACQLYLLEQSRRHSLVLLAAPGPREQLDRITRTLSAWWERSGNKGITVKDVRPSGQGGRTYVEAVIQVKGQWLGDRASLGDIAEPLLAGVFFSMAELSQSALDGGLQPGLTPSMLWADLDGAAAVVTAPFAVPSNDSSETALLHSAACSVTSLAGGMDYALLQSRQTSLPALDQWNSGTSRSFSSLVSRCTTHWRERGRITSFADLRGQQYGPVLGSRGAPGSQRVGRATVAGDTSAPDARRGLAKVAGMHELKELLVRDVIRPLQDPEPFQRYGLTVPSGVLLYGPPGCGKTYIARQLAEELGHFFLELTPSEIGSPYIHKTTLLIRQVFEDAARNAPAVLFIDEFEALVPSRNQLGGEQQYKAEEVNEFLANLNDCASKRILVIAATNEPERIDVAVRRTGRLDKLIYVGPPDAKARAEMLKLHLGERPLEDGVDLERISAALGGYSASDLKFLVDEAARQAMAVGGRISEAVLLEVRRRVPQSVSTEVEARYRKFDQRGV